MIKAEADFYDLHYVEHGYYTNRIIIPMYDDSGELVAFQARSILPTVQERYLTKGPRTLYRPWDVGETTVKQIVCVEGPFDVYAVRRVHEATVGLLGIMPSERQVNELIDLATRTQAPVCIWFDVGASSEAYALQLKLQPHVLTTVIEHSGKKDPGEMTPNEVQNILCQLL